MLRRKELTFVNKTKAANPVLMKRIYYMLMYMTIIGENKFQKKTIGEKEFYSIIS